MKEEQYLKRKIQQLRVKCPEENCKIKCRVIDASPMENRKTTLKMSLECKIHGGFDYYKTLKSLLK